MTLEKGHLKTATIRTKAVSTRSHIIIEVLNFISMIRKYPYIYIHTYIYTAVCKKFEIRIVIILCHYMIMSVF